jgi:cell division protein FtsL
VPKLSLNIGQILSRANGNFGEQNKVLESSMIIIIIINYFIIIINAYDNYVV